MSSAGKRARSFFLSPFLSLTVLLCIAEVVAGQMSPYAGFPVAGEVPRNPRRLRGWPEYLSGETPPGKKLVVLISNSQGYAKEFDGDKIYASLVRECECSRS